MPTTKGGFKLRDIFGSIGSKLNIKSPSMSSSTHGASGQRAYQQAQRKRFGHEKESKFQYDVRMRKEAKKSAESADLGLAEKKSRFSKGVSRKWNPITKKFESTFDPSSIGLETPVMDISLKGLETTLNPNDLTRQAKLSDLELSNFGVTDEMSFGEAFQQAELKGIEPGASFNWRGDPYKFEYEGDAFFESDIEIEDEIKKQMDAGARAAERKRLKEEAKKELEIKKKPFDYSGSRDFSSKRKL